MSSTLFGKSIIFMRDRMPYFYESGKHFLKIVNGSKNNQRFKSCSGLLKNYYNICKGQSCLIIGNGPSLNTKDLEKSKRMISFASNRIYNIFQSTDWRPSYYCISDRKLYLKSYSEIINKGINNGINNAFVQIDPIRRYPDLKQCSNVCYIKLIKEDFYPSLPRFSDNMLNGIYDGHTVTYMMLQLSIFMGFKKIYLLGVDHNYSQVLNPDGTVSFNSNVRDHFSDSDVIANTPAIYKITVAYQAAKEYADSHGIKIYNATRGGKLEVFERVDFDSLFPPEDNENNVSKK